MRGLLQQGGPQDRLVRRSAARGQLQDVPDIRPIFAGYWQIIRQNDLSELSIIDLNAYTYLHFMSYFN